MTPRDDTRRTGTASETGLEPGASTSQRRQRGFSLIEVVVAMAILSLGMTSAIALFTAATGAHRRAIHRSNAADLAEWAMADIESALRLGASPDQISESPPAEAIARDWPGYVLEVELLPIGGASGDDEILVEVEVTWQTRGRDQSIEFQQIVTRQARIR